MYRTVLHTTGIGFLIRNYLLYITGSAACLESGLDETEKENNSKRNRQITEEFMSG
jgi:hypothetical protein